jgi:type II secretory pathway component PulF
MGASAWQLPERSWLDDLKRTLGVATEGDDDVYVERKALRAVFVPLARMVAAGIPPATALESLSKASPEESVQRLCDALSRRIRSGASEADAMADHPRTFTPTMVAEVRNAAAHGQIGTAFQTMADTIKQEMDISRKAIKAAVYPVFATLFLIVVFLTNLVTLIPKLEPIYNTVPFAELPLSTRYMVVSSHLFNAHPKLYVLGLIAGFIGLFFWGRSFQGRSVLFSVLQRLPVVRTAIEQQVRARFLRDLARLQRESGRSMIELACAAVPFPPLAERLRMVGDRLDQGIALSVALEESDFFPPTTLIYIKGGEDAGTLADMLKMAAEVETEEANQRIELLTSMMETVATPVIGGFVALQLFATYSGIFAIQDILRKRGQDMDKRSSINRAPHCANCSEVASAALFTPDHTIAVATLDALRPRTTSAGRPG